MQKLTQPTPFFNVFYTNTSCYFFNTITAKNILFSLALFIGKFTLDDHFGCIVWQFGDWKNNTHETAEQSCFWQPAMFISIPLSIVVICFGFVFFLSVVPFFVMGDSFGDGPSFHINLVWKKWIITLALFFFIDCAPLLGKRLCHCWLIKSTNNKNACWFWQNPQRSAQS